MEKEKQEEGQQMQQIFKKNVKKCKQIAESHQKCTVNALNRGLTIEMIELAIIWCTQILITLQIIDWWRSIADKWWYCVLHFGSAMVIP